MSKTEAIDKKEIDKKALLLAYEPGEVTETVRIGPIEATIKKIVDPTALRRIVQEGQNRHKLPYKVGDATVRIDEVEGMAYAWLMYSLVDPKLSFEEIVAVSRRTGLDCLIAGDRAAAMAGGAYSAVEDAKNG